MKRLIAWLAAAALSLAAHGEDFRLLTFNIRYANPKDGLDRWENRREHLVKLIRDECDLAGLQEVLPQQRAEIAERCAEFAVIGIGRGPGDEGEASPIMFRKDRFAALASGTFWLSDTPETPGSHTWGNTLPRICTWVKLRDAKSGAAFFFFNTHLDHESQPSRVRAVELIVKRMQARNGSEPVLLAGDFNIHHDNPAFAPLAKASESAADLLPMISAYQIAGIPPEGTFHAFTGKPESGAIDFIFLEHDRWKLRSVTVLKTTYPAADGTARYPS
ncbi:MAG TPA: endonuclease/exonuclease/phosphatase family protein, partial [Chthoniobacteraceae bacterium]|nr:endonuclease/exonuclease/phosphatase family protein [Chthoniobacteraceae bacterium]